MEVLSSEGWPSFWCLACWLLLATAPPRSDPSGFTDMDQRALGELAERAAELAECGGLEAAGELTRLVNAAAERHRYAPWAVASMIAAEWDRLGIRRVPGRLLIRA